MTRSATRACNGPVPVACRAQNSCARSRKNVIKPVHTSRVRTCRAQHTRNCGRTARIPRVAVVPMQRPCHRHTATPRAPPLRRSTAPISWGTRCTACAHWPLRARPSRSARGPTENAHFLCGGYRQAPLKIERRHERALRRHFLPNLCRRCEAAWRGMVPRMLAETDPVRAQPAARARLCGPP